MFFHTWLKALPPIRLRPKPKSMAKMALSAVFFSSGVRVRRTSCTGAKAEIISDKGDTTDFCAPSSCHTVFMESESLPTGMLSPSAWQVCDTASTVR